MLKNTDCDNKTNTINEPIAIVGVNCQFPGVEHDIEDLDAFHEMLLNQQTPIKEVPKNRWDISQYYDADRKKEDKIVTRKGGFMMDPSLFDAAFFNIPPIEAKQIDPQQRLFLEVSVRALNEANITCDSLKYSNTGVYCGISTHEYSQLNYKDKIQFNAYSCIGSAASAAAGRLSHFLNLKGPCITVDTACSSSLSALYLAVMALRMQDCDTAIVGGVHLNLCPDIWIGLSKANMLSALGETRSFDAAADGYVRSEGCAVVVLKRLRHALKDHNKIHAVIKSIVINQDGGGRSLVAPNREAQIAIHQSALEKAQLKAGDIDYIETHGTATIRGDKTELEAIQAVHQDQHSKDKPLIIGALKSNLGHSISASGIAALVKVIGSLKQQIIPPNLHYTTPNVSVDPLSIPAVIPLQGMAFPKLQNKKRYGQISNFGFTGTNVSAIIEEAPTVVRNDARNDDAAAFCFVISANSERSLHRMLKSHLDYLKRSSQSLSDICYTLINCRDHYDFRCAIVAQDKDSLIKKIESGDCAFKKVTAKKETVFSGTAAEKNYEVFLSGANLRSDNRKVVFNPVDLPLYIFDRIPYWHDIRATNEIKVPDDWSFELQWECQPLNKNNARELGSHWLLIGDPSGNVALQESGMIVIREPDGYRLEDLDGIIVVDGFEVSKEATIDSRIDFQKNTLKHLLALLKALSEKAIELKLIILSVNSRAEWCKDPISLDSSPLIGFCKSLCLELPQYQTRFIAIDTENKDTLAECIVDELTYNHGQYYEHLVAYREGQRRVSRLKKSRLPQGKTWSCAEGRYLITGGCGGLGLVSSEALLSAGAREVVLVSRTVDSPSISASIKTIQSKYPDRVIRLVALDISDKAGLQTLLRELNEDGGLKGIIHAAGASLHKSLLSHQNKDVDDLFSAKVKGGWYLHALTQHYDLDFFVVFSSISSAFGSNKGSVYSATNSFLDALISERHRLGLVGTAIQWGPWAEVGMAKKRSHNPGLTDAFIGNEQGQALLQYLIANPMRHPTIIAPNYLKFMLDFVPESPPSFYTSLAADLTNIIPASNPKHSPWLSDYAQVDPKDQLRFCKRMLSEICQELLETATVHSLEEDAGFFELGLDSLMMAELAGRVKENLKPLVPVVATIAFDYPSINKLSWHIQSELCQHFQKKQTVSSAAVSQSEAIAIIGMSCSLPNAPDIAAFERLLENGDSGIKAIPKARWDNQAYYDSNPDAPGKTYVNTLGLIDTIKLFDPQFFGISPREAPFIEPQQRLFLENCYYALEDANYPIHALRGSSTGVFAGVSSSQDYYTLLEKRGFSHEEQGMFSLTGKALNIVSGRVAYTFDFKGPALSIDTACSSSLVALHYACNSLKNREIDFALAGGVNVLLRPEGIINLSRAKALSPEGLCKTFDEGADGYVRAEGCGVLFLKRMSDALRDQDRILAVIKGSAVNNDGKSAGLTAPNGKSQEAVMQQALSQAQLRSSDISFIEAHGTATTLGDPIEVQAINAVYGKQRGNENPLYIGAVKTNIGHLESASGIAGLIKVIIGLQKKRLYKNLNFNRLNPNIKLDSLKIVLHNRDWHGKTLNAAGISAFGFSGTNAHVILQEYPEPAVQKEVGPVQTAALILSAKSPLSLDALVKCYQQFLATSNDNFNNVCFTAAIGRDHYPYRLAVVAQDAHTASELLKKGMFASAYGENTGLGLQDNTELHCLIRAYLQGKNVDWASYYKAHYPHLTKVTLPHYPFERSEYWLDFAEHTTVEPHSIPPLLRKGLPHADNALLEKEPHIKKRGQARLDSYEVALEHLSEIQWSKLNQPLAKMMEAPDFWVISSDEKRVKRVLGLQRYQRVNTIDALERLEDKNIVFLYEQDQFYDLFNACQRMFKSPPASFILVTENAYVINKNACSTVNPHHTMAVAFWKSFKNELELHKNIAIDLDAQSSITTCIDSIFNLNNRETQFAVRGTVYVPRLKKKELLLTAVQQKKIVYDQSASYLITGGSGGLAKPLMDHLIANGVTRIVITSRSECSTATKILIENARKKAVTISHYVADAGNFSQMKRIIAAIEHSAQPLKGVFHLAGMIQNDLIVNLAEPALQQVLHAKMESALILHQLTKDVALDLFVLFSSASSILGSRRQANYSAANGFLDGLAHLRQQQGLPALAINWGVFQTVGMAAGNLHSLKKRGFIPLEEGSIALLDVLLQSDAAQLMVCPMQWDLYFKNTPQPIEFSDQDDRKTPPHQPSFICFLQRHTQKEQVTIVGQLLCDIAADVLGLKNVNQLSAKSDLFAMGMDSLMSLELRSRIHDRLQCFDLNLPIEYFINDSRIDKITNNIVKELQMYIAQVQYSDTEKHLHDGATTLSDTQYGFWLVDKMGFSFNCPKQIQFYGTLNTDYLYKALAFTINQNGAFWLNFHADIPIQMPKRQGEFILFYQDISQDYDQEVLNERLYETTRQRISLHTPPLIRVYLYKLKESLYELHIIIPHIVLDESSYRIFMEQLKNHYTSLLRGKSLIPTLEQHSYLDYVQQNNSHYQKDLEDKITFWQAYNRGFEKLSFGPTHHLPDAAGHAQNLFHYPMDTVLVEKFKAWHKEKNINVSTGLIAAFHIVFYKLSAQKKIPILILHNGREGNRFKSVVGLLLEYKRINITLNEQYRFMEFFKSLEQEFIKAAPFQKCSQYIKNMGLKESRFSIFERVIALYHRCFLSKKFTVSHPNRILRSYYLQRISKARWYTTTSKVKDKINRRFRTKLRLLKPNQLTVVFNIAAGFFIKTPRDTSFADLEMTIPNHYGSVDRPIGNQALWIYFTKDQYDQYRLSINGPLTKACKDLMAHELNAVLAQIMETDEKRISELL